MPTPYFTGGMLPDGSSYGFFERVTMTEGGKPGMAPVLVVRLSGGGVSEAVIGGRDLLPLCTSIGRHAMHWV